MSLEVSWLIRVDAGAVVTRLDAVTFGLGAGRTFLLEDVIVGELL